jgi:protein SCO1
LLLVREMTLRAKFRAVLGSLVCVAGMAAIGAADAASWGASPLSTTDIEVLDQDGKRLKFYADLVRGRTVIISFMFTGCKTVCPPQTAIMTDVRAKLNAAEYPLKDVLLISLTVDPLGDGPIELKRFAKKFEISPAIQKGWVFLTGDPTQLSLLLKSLGATQAIPNDHTDLIWLANDTKKRWTRTSGFSSPDQLIQLLQEVQR